jgi:hypothetical protein
MVRNPITLSATPPRYDLPPPALGQDNDAIRAWLGRPVGTHPPAPRPAGVHGVPEVDAAVGKPS